MLTARMIFLPAILVLGTDLLLIFFAPREVVWRVFQNSSIGARAFVILVYGSILVAAAWQALGSPSLRISGLTPMNVSFCFMGIAVMFRFAYMFWLAWQDGPLKENVPRSTINLAINLGILLACFLTAIILTATALFLWKWG